MKYRNLVLIFLLGTLLSLWAWPSAAAESRDKTVLLRVHVPSTSG